MNHSIPGGPPPAVPHAEARLALGALVLGALDPAEREAVEAHVATCAACTAELADLAALPGLLARVTPEQAAAISTRPPNPPDDELLERILARARVRRLRGHRITAWTAAAVAVAAGVVWVFTAGPLASDERPTGVVVVQGTSQSSDVGGKVTLSPTPNGTQVSLTLWGVRPGEDCQLIAQTADGRTEVASTWRASYEGRATVTGSTSLSLADIDHLEITTPDGRRLLNLSVPG